MHYRIEIPLSGRSADDLTERLAEYAVEGIEERDDAVAAYFLSEVEAREAAGALGGGAPEAVADQNWSAAWQAEWAPLEIGARFFLCPAWIDAPTPPGRIRLEMVPGNVFGGGDHPTTQLCLELLERAVTPGARVADIGAGTGVLTQASRGLGARAIGCDIDPASAGLVDFLGSADALAGGRFDGVIANIHLGVLRDLRGELLRLLRPGGWLLLSGFLPEQADETIALFGPARELLARDGWCAALFLDWE